jgi:hypothetical protein
VSEAKAAAEHKDANGRWCDCVDASCQSATREGTLISIEPFAYVRPQAVFCDWCEKEVVPAEKIEFVHLLPSGRRLLVHVEHRQDIVSAAVEHVHDDHLAISPTEIPQRHRHTHYDATCDICGKSVR